VQVFFFCAIGVVMENIGLPTEYLLSYNSGHLTPQLGKDATATVRVGGVISLCG